MAMADRAPPPADVLLRLPSGTMVALCWPDTAASYEAQGYAVILWEHLSATLAAFVRIRRCIPGAEIVSRRAADEEAARLATKRQGRDPMCLAIAKARAS